MPEARSETMSRKRLTPPRNREKLGIMYVSAFPLSPHIAMNNRRYIREIALAYDQASQGMNKHLFENLA